MRLVIFVALWLMAGLIWASFSNFSVEAGISEFAERASMVYLGPLDAAQGLAFMIVSGGYNAWPGRETLEGGVALAILCAFIEHAVVTLTRKTRRQFLFWIAVQVILLAASVASVLYYFRWDADHMHG